MLGTVGYWMTFLRLGFTCETAVVDFDICHREQIKSAGVLSEVVPRNRNILLAMAPQYHLRAEYD
jgi:hypothetical protein